MPDSQSDRWPQIERLYNEALEIGAADRDAFLMRACGHDTALLAEMRSLLGYERAAGQFLEREDAAKQVLYLGPSEATWLDERYDLGMQGPMGKTTISVFGVATQDRATIATTVWVRMLQAVQQHVD